MKTMNNNRQLIANTLRISVIAIAIFLTATFSLKASSSGRSNYSITPVENASAPSELKAWNLSYHQLDNLDVTIMVVPSSKGNEFKVVSDYFEITYANGDNNFGIKTSNWKINPTQTSIVVDPERVLDQEYLVPRKVTESEALELIAYYLPMLFKNN